MDINKEIAKINKANKEHGMASDKENSDGFATARIRAAWNVAASFEEYARRLAVSSAEATLLAWQEELAYAIEVDSDVAYIKKQITMAEEILKYAESARDEFYG